jgi:rubrerythrin
MDNEMVRTIKTAVRTKKREIEYYRKAAENTTNPEGKKVFGYLADEEGQHLEALKRHLASAGDEDAWLSDEKTPKLKCGLRRRKPEGIIPEKTDSHAGDLEALMQAIEIEKKSIISLEEAACEAEETKAKKILNYLIEAEKTHLKELEVQHAFLKSEGFWYDNEITLS